MLLALSGPLAFVAWALGTLVVLGVRRGLVKLDEPASPPPPAG